MPICEFSGEDTETLVEIEIEGVRMQVAPKYARFGKKVEQHTPATRVSQRRRMRSERTEAVRKDAPKLLREAFHKLDSDEEAVAKNLGMKESQFKSYLSGNHPIPIGDARKLEKAFELTLIEQSEAPAEETTSAYRTHEEGGSGLTLGDLLKGSKRR